MRQEALRESLAASGLVQQIGNCERKLLAIVASAMRVKPENLERLRVQTMAIGKTLDSMHKKLNKVLPDLRTYDGALDQNLADPVQTLEEAHRRAREACRKHGEQRELDEEHTRPKWRH